MLVFSRRLGEKIEIHGPAVVELLEIIGNKVRIGITAADEVPVLRAELDDDAKAALIRRAKGANGDQHSQTVPD
jgi:carbon storage regulator CsrA